MQLQSKKHWLVTALLGCTVTGAACRRESGADRVGVPSPPRSESPPSGQPVDGIFLPKIYTLDAEMPMDQIGFVATPPDDGVPSLYTCRTDGTHVRRITYAPGGVSDPTVLADGRLLFRMGRANCDDSSSDWFTVRTDGTELAAARAEEIEIATRGLQPGVHRREPLGSSSVVRDETDTGQLYCLDGRISDTAPAGLIRNVRIFGVRRREGSGLESEVLGDVLVESDGSFYVELPARTPFRLATLDERGTVLRAMTTWMWVMPGEQRGCIGCHEDRDRTPPNRHVLALRKPPQRVGHAEPTARDRAEVGSE